MKSLTTILVILVLVSVDASPLINRVEDDLTPLRELGHEINIDDPSHRWTLIPDSEGKMHLIDLNSYKVPTEPLFDAEKDVKFILSTRKSKKQGEEIKFDLESIENSSFNANHPTRITIHGWNGDATSFVNSKVTEEYLKLGDFNCIMVDWSKGSGTLDYIAARYRVFDVAKLTAKFVDFLSSKGFINLKQLHIIGHSLGAHAAGLTGQYIGDGKVQAIFGLDPAGPLFYLDYPDERISSSDGLYVEIIHTNGFTLGFGKPLGDADFYPNFGSYQPGCGLDLTGSCSHGRSATYFAESITSRNFVATKCGSFEEIGKSKCTDQSPNSTFIMSPEPANYGLEGIYYFKTNAFEPFAIRIDED